MNGLGDTGEVSQFRVFIDPYNSASLELVLGLFKEAGVVVGAHLFHPFHVVFFANLELV